MTVLVGTSGYQYAFWRGHFYPDKHKEADMLGYYATRLPTVEINNTFYRMPKREVLERWASQVPDTFRFAIKASRRITHISRLKEVTSPVGFLLDNLEALGDKLGVVLFQLPPNLKYDEGRLEHLLSLLTKGKRHVLEARHESWFQDACYARLRAADVALCMNDAGEGEAAVPWVATASFGYLRLRKESYQDAELAEVAARIRSEAAWSDCYAYFKHEPAAPDLAARLQPLCG
jgi:uncharacterized protein YecE (DUF72 family)